MSRNIPDRWIPYKACGKIIEGTRIICFKVPLRKKFQTGVKEIKEIWDIKSLIEHVPKLGAVVDLTNTARYYDPKELVNAGVLHKKILIPGRIIPPDDKVKEFMDAMDEFLGKDCELLVGVHCTHGLNRTGYMVCRYMRDRLGVPANVAIKKFEKARGYQIERDNYIADLLGKAPPPPDLGSDTVLKPTVNKQEMKYNTPLSGYEEDEDEESDRRRNRYGNKRSYESDRKHSKNRRQGHNQDGRPRTNSRSYDYKYDY